MCDPVSAGMFAINAAGQIGQHQEKVKGVKSRNRARLRQFDYENQDYLNEVKLNNAVWKNDKLVAEVEQEGVFKAMVDQWTVADAQLDQLFADYDFKLQDEIIKMYENDYAGTQTGRTAGRLAAKSAKEKGYAMAAETQKLILDQKELEIRNEAYRNDAVGKINSIFEKVRHPPMHGHTPVPPELEAKPSKASLVLGLATSAVSAYGFSKMTAPKATGMESMNIGTGASSTGTMGALQGAGQVPKPLLPGGEIMQGHVNLDPGGAIDTFTPTDTSYSDPFLA